MAVSFLGGAEYYFYPLYVSYYSFRSHWKSVQHELTEYSYKEKMLYLILNSDETFELRWVDYYSISGFDEIMNLEAGTIPPSSLVDSEQNQEDTNSVKKLTIQEQDLIVEKKINEILEKKKQQERNINICMYGRHELNGDNYLKFTVTHCYHNTGASPQVHEGQVSSEVQQQNANQLFDPEDLKNPFTGEIFQNLTKMYMNVKIPLKIENNFKNVQFCPNKQQQD